MKSAEKPTETRTLSQIVSDLIDETNGDRDEATSRLLVVLANNEALYQSVIRPMINQAARELISAEVHKRRRESWNWSPPDQSKSMNTLARGVEKSLMEYWRLESTGKPIGDATKDDLRTEIGLYRERERENAIRADWLELIFNRLGRVAKNTPVRSKLKESDLRDLKQQAEG
jgi:hypothetical protein